MNSDKTDFTRLLVLSNNWPRFNDSPSVWTVFTFLFQVQKSLFWDPVRQSAHFYAKSNVGLLLCCFYYTCIYSRSGRWGGFWQQTQLRLWYTRWLLVVLTTSTACCTTSTSMPRRLCNQFYTRPLVSSRGNGSLIASHLHSEMIFTGCQCLRGLSTNSALSSTGACIRLFESTSKLSFGLLVCYAYRWGIHLKIGSIILRRRVYWCLNQAPSYGAEGGRGQLPPPNWCLAPRPWPRGPVDTSGGAHSPLIM